MQPSEPLKESVAAAPGASTLYVVATPIGNLGDVTHRALTVLADVDLILAEDTRRTRKLLNRFDLRTPMRSLHEHNEQALAAELTLRLSAGERMALVSDAGTPLVSDPGFVLVRRALEAGVAVVPVPGPSAVLAALVASGLPVDRFTFVGYLPRKRSARRRLLDELGEQPGTLVFLESPRRLAASLVDAAEILGARQACVARELTKLHEEFIRGTLPEVAARLEDTEVRGEITVCVAGFRAGDQAAASRSDARAAPLDVDEIGRAFGRLLEEGRSRKEALAELARRYGVPRREVYRSLFVEEESE